MRGEKNAYKGGSTSDIIKQRGKPKAAGSIAFLVLASLRDCSLIDISHYGIHFSALNTSHLEAVIKRLNMQFLSLKHLQMLTREAIHQVALPSHTTPVHFKWLVGGVCVFGSSRKQ